MTTVEFLNKPVVYLVRKSGGDESVVQAARVSVVGENGADSPFEVSFDPRNTQPDFKKIEEDRQKSLQSDNKLIGYLMKQKHGSPFEHNSMTFYVKAPIFVFREFHRHRVGFSYNEMSGRYTTLPAEFYVPDSDRKLINVGSSAHPRFEAGTQEQYSLVNSSLTTAYESAWSTYRTLLDQGIANEVARLVLPVGIMSQMYVTCNARSLMNFLSLRTSTPEATFPSNPQYEIEQVALELEGYFKLAFPITYDYWVKYGRVSP